MKNLLVALLSFASSVTPLMAASGPVAESCTVGDRYFTQPLEYIGFYFDGGIKLLDGASASIKCDGKTVATSTNMKVSNYTYKRTQGELSIFFDKQNLPKGKDYTLSVAPGSIAYEADGTANGEITQNFTVPESLGPVHFDVEQGITIEKTAFTGGLPTFFWGIETEPVGTPSFILYREGVAIREFPAHVCWDWDLGQAYAETEDGIVFEKGVNYTLVFPAGNARAMYRDDIVNEEATFTFIGGYEGPEEQLNYVWCNLLTEHPEVLNTVTFTYDRPFRLTDGARMQLWEGDCAALLKEAVAYVDTGINCFAVSADFGGFKMTSEAGYTVVIPEGTLISESGNPVVNSRNVLSIDKSAGIGEIDDDIRQDALLYDLYGRRVTNPQRGSVYIRGGRKVVF